MDAAETYLVYSKREVDLPISVRFTVIVQCPSWVNSSPLALANVTGSFGGKPDISDGRSEAEAIPDMVSRWL